MNDLSSPPGDAAPIDQPLHPRSRAMRAARHLRRATRREHAAVEAVPLMASLMSDRVDLPTYLEVLRRHLRIHAGWEQAHATWLQRQRWAYQPRTPALRADLGALQAGAEEPWPVAAPAAEDDPAAWGMLYVVEGSALGGQVIARHVQRHCPQAAAGLRCFAGTAAPPGRWPRFLALLDQALPDARARRRAVAGARLMFGHFHGQLAAPH